MQKPLPEDWYASHENIVILARHLADQGEAASTVAYAVEKPWKFTEEFEAALEELETDIP